MFIIFFLSFFVSCCPCGVKQGQAERVQTKNAQTNLEDSSFKCSLFSLPIPAVSWPILSQFQNLDSKFQKNRRVTDFEAL